MKTLARILVIVVVFAVVMGLMYFAVNANSNNANAPVFDRGNRQFQGDRFNPNGPRPEFRGEREGGGGFGLIFGMIKNVGIVAVLVALIVVPKNFLQQQKRQAVPAQVND